MNQISPSSRVADHATGPPWAVEVLRIGVGAIWTLNLIFVIAPQNAFFPTFASTATAFAPTSLGGPLIASFIAGHPLFFSWAIAMATAYLAAAFLLGLTTRIACGVGILLSVGLLVAQFGNTFGMPGATDVGPHPLYLLVYGVLLFGGAGREFSMDSSMRAHHTIQIRRALKGKSEVDSTKASGPTAATLPLCPPPLAPTPAAPGSFRADEGNGRTAPSREAAGS